MYRAGFATSQESYEKAAYSLFAMLDELNERLATRRYLFGSKPVETDWRLFVTLIRFDPVYVGHFKCNLRRIFDYPNLYGYLRDLYQIPGVASTVDFDHIKRHYYYTHDDINSTHRPNWPTAVSEQPHRQRKAWLTRASQNNLSSCRATEPCDRKQVRRLGSIVREHRKHLSRPVS